MAKKPNKNTPTKMSNIQRTIQEGKSYVQQSIRVFKNRDKHFKKAQISQKKSRKPISKKSSKKTKTVHKKKTKNPTNKKRNTNRRQSAHQNVASNAPPAVSQVNRTQSRTSNVGVGRTSSRNSQVIQQELHDRLQRNNATVGKLNFSLRWWDPNDLDIHVVCPCNYHINFYQKKCPTCEGQLDIDMNNRDQNMSTQPVEHVFFNTPKPGLYKFWVKYYDGPKQHPETGIRGLQKSRYVLSLHENMDQIFRYEDYVSTSQSQIHYDYTLRI